MQLDATLVEIVICGIVGGFVNCLITDSAFRRPAWTDDVWNPGFLGPVVAGAVSGFCSWALSLPASPGGASTSQYAPFANAILVGFSGARWLTNEIDKRFLKAAAATAAGKTASATASSDIAGATPLKALAIARAMK